MEDYLGDQEETDFNFENPDVEFEVKTPKEEEIKEKVLEILKVHKNFLRTYRLRSWYMLKRAEIIHDFAKFVKLEFKTISPGDLREKTIIFRSLARGDLLRRLRIYHQKEKRLIEIIGRARIDTLRAFDIHNIPNDVRDELVKRSQKEIGLSSRELEMVSRIYSTLVDKFYENLGLIQDRLRAEERFLNTPNHNNAEMYIDLLKIEIEKQKQIEDEAVKMQPYIQKTLITTAGLGPVLSKILMATTGVSFWQSQDLDFITVSFIALIGAIVTINNLAFLGLFLSKRYKNKLNRLTADLSFLDENLLNFQ